jgi:DNA (cytosine-5)-methyltransferase 1
MADDRGNLALEYLRLAARLRPRWLVWENVPGVLSSSGGRDFGAFLGGLAELGYGWAYRILDAQYVGLAQRRKRVFVVGCTGSWQRAAAVLLERHSLSWDPAPNRETGQTIAPPIAGCSNGGGANGPGRTADDAESLIVQPYTVANVLTARMGKGINSTLDEGQTPVLAFHNRQDPDVSGDVTHPLGAQDNGMAILAPALTASNNPSRSPQSSEVTQQIGAVFRAVLQVRRLTPRECERLMGFADDYTLVPYRGKPAADGPRYKALGNSMAVPVMRWIGRRIAAVDRIEDDDARRSTAMRTVRLIA